MLNFKTLSFEDKDIFESYYSKIYTNSYEYLFSSLYLWRDYCNTEYILYDDVLIIRKFDEKKKYYYMMPLGYSKENLNGVVKFLLATCNNSSLYLFGDSENTFIKDLNNYTTYSIDTIPDINCNEYIYATNDLINLKGNKYRKKRNHINSFVKNYNFSVKTIDSDIILNDCMTLLDNWHETRNICSKELLMESSAISDFLSKEDSLHLKTVAVYVESTLVGFAIGEKVNNTAIIHVERCDRNFLGSYAFINHQFLIKDFSDTLYVNRQEDCGVEGLRIAKQSYYPHHMVEKYMIKIT